MTGGLVESVARAISQRTYATTVGHSDCLEWEDMRESDRNTYRRAALDCIPIVLEAAAKCAEGELMLGHEGYDLTGFAGENRRCRVIATAIRNLASGDDA